MQKSYVYVMTNTYRTTFYIGITTNLQEQVLQHIEGTGSKFTAKYNLKDLIYFEEFTDVEQAIYREKQLKNWHKDWKINLIRKVNPKLKTLNLFE